MENEIKNQFSDFGFNFFVGINKLFGFTLNLAHDRIDMQSNHLSIL